MRYSFVSAAILALASSVFAQESTDGFDVITSPTNGQKVAAGKPFDITWVPGEDPEYQNGTATIVLLQGSNQGDLKIGDTIASSVKNSLGKYTWNVPSTAGTFATYGLRITLDDDASTAAKEDTIFQYSFPFQIVSAAEANAGTTTIQLGTGTAFVPEPTTTSTSVITSTISSTSVTTQTTVSLVQTNSSNFTMSATATALSTSSRSTRVPSSTSGSPAPAQTVSAGAANAVSGGMVLAAGLVMALVL